MTSLLAGGFQDGELGLGIGEAAEGYGAWGG